MPEHKTAKHVDPFDPRETGEVDTSDLEPAGTMEESLTSRPMTGKLTVEQRRMERERQQFLVDPDGKSDHAVTGGPLQEVHTNELEDEPSLALAEVRAEAWVAALDRVIGPGRYQLHASGHSLMAVLAGMVTLRLKERPRRSADETAVSSDVCINARVLFSYGGVAALTYTTATETFHDINNGGWVSEERVDMYATQLANVLLVLHHRARDARVSLKEVANTLDMILPRAMDAMDRNA